MDWEVQLNEARSRGWQANRLILSRELLKRARLTNEERRWVLMPLQNNLQRYEEIRTLIRRLPGDHKAEIFLADGVVGNPGNGHVWWMTPSGPEEISSEWNGDARCLPDAVLAVARSTAPPKQDCPGDQSAPADGAYLADEYEELEMDQEGYWQEDLHRLRGPRSSHAADRAR